MTLKKEICQLAAMHGFDLCHVTRAQFSDVHRHALDQWVNNEMHGTMHYMAEASRVQLRKEPTKILTDIQSVLSVAMRYHAPPYTLDYALKNNTYGIIGAYAHGDDYHDIMKRKLKALAQSLDQLLGVHDQRVFVDTAPILEHALAERAGLGWQGKHTLTIHREFGSYFLLGEIFTTAPIEADLPASSHCGSCNACITACPTQAIVAPYVVDARRCISYLTIEYQGIIDRALRPLMGNRIFGCDDCQMVCPWNRKVMPLTLDHFQSRQAQKLPSLSVLFSLDDVGFRERFHRSPIKRSKRSGLLRNVAIAMGNSGNIDFIPLLLGALEDDEAIIRAHSVWATARILALNPCNPHLKKGEIASQFAYHWQHERDAAVCAEFSDAMHCFNEVFIGVNDAQ
ncbi:MAG: tRNA epoxyqueuosine(34) reductase QueG [Zetaproteobacteria bacterium]|nr:tRNA epoxyqueuosine(34) reductase QueG [Zetaproteobacteria bacterium]